MIIRRFRDQDANELSILITKNLETVNIKDYSKEAIDTLLPHNAPNVLIERSKKTLILIAEIDKRIVGTISLDDDQVRNFFIEPDRHGNPPLTFHN
jgi:hypothetical protein